MTSDGLGEMFEGDSADMCAGKLPLMLMGGRSEGLAYVDPGARTPIGVSGYSYCTLIVLQYQSSLSVELPAYSNILLM